MIADTKDREVRSYARTPSRRPVIHSGIVLFRRSSRLINFSGAAALQEQAFRVQMLGKLPLLEVMETSTLKQLSF
jgi:hypothetical protein